MAPSLCPDPCGTRWVSWFQAILYHIPAHFKHIWCFMSSAYCLNAAYNWHSCTTIHSILVQFTCLAVLFHNLSPGPLWSTSLSRALYFVLHTYLHPVITLLSQHMPIPSQSVLLKCWSHSRYFAIGLCSVVSFICSTLVTAFDCWYVHEYNIFISDPLLLWNTRQRQIIQ